eukprot:CAMPEP_0202898718 /NCGR_PEP_ID=MMETSP1392-20130828/7164_1 /ASSEMBLY_ACC=CAM_ASM_000868 /TAXON_ID=225041 /ORGANISM="Chlamydomonas chlamydogama, Strain SAG 11-48b" /LENGTH=185 /DNA_ID=CAMNT_0049584721 /DNA_START=107 /DNA_END=665 /DNA_ORIENTATION=+
MATASAGGGFARKLKAFWNHPAGPKTIHFWAPTFKWGISLANIADMQRPPEKISLPQQCAITATGIIWSRYSTQITPVNYNLLAVNAFMAVTGMYQFPGSSIMSMVPLKKREQPARQDCNSCSTAEQQRWHSNTAEQCTSGAAQQSCQENWPSEVAAAWSRADVGSSCDGPLDAEGALLDAQLHN